MIYLDNAATTMRKPPQVVQAVVKALESIGNAGRGAYHASLDASRIIYDTRVKLVEFFGGDHAEQVAFTANSTESLNLAIKGLFYPGDHLHAWLKCDRESAGSDENRKNSKDAWTALYRGCFSDSGSISNQRKADADRCTLLYRS